MRKFIIRFAFCAVVIVLLAIGGLHYTKFSIEQNLVAAFGGNISIGSLHIDRFGKLNSIRNIEFKNSATIGSGSIHKIELSHQASALATSQFSIRQVTALGVNFSSEDQFAQQLDRKLRSMQNELVTFVSPVAAETETEVQEADLSNDTITQWREQWQASLVGFQKQSETITKSLDASKAADTLFENPLRDRQSWESQLQAVDALESQLNQLKSAIEARQVRLPKEAEKVKQEFQKLVTDLHQQANRPRLDAIKKHATDNLAATQKLLTIELLKRFEVPIELTCQIAAAAAEVMHNNDSHQKIKKSRGTEFWPVFSKQPAVAVNRLTLNGKSSAADNLSFDAILQNVARTNKQTSNFSINFSLRSETETDKQIPLNVTGSLVSGQPVAWNTQWRGSGGAIQTRFPTDPNFAVNYSGDNFNIFINSDANVRTTNIIWTAENLIFETELFNQQNELVHNRNEVSNATASISAIVKLDEPDATVINSHMPFLDKLIEQSIPGLVPDRFVQDKVTAPIDQFAIQVVIESQTAMQQYNRLLENLDASRRIVFQSREQIAAHLRPQSIRTASRP